MADGFESLDLITQGTGETSVDVERAATHAGNGAHVLNARIGELANNQGLSRAEGVADHAGDLDLERFGLGAAENGPDLATLARAKFIDRDGGDRSRGGLGAERSDR
jgi:hypothetical protein